METESSVPTDTLKPGLPETSPLVREIAAVLIASGRTLSIHAIASACRRTTGEVREAVETLKARAGELGLRVVESSSTGVQVLVDGAYRRALRALNPESTPSRAKLSPEAAETLALLQDRGPMTIGEIKAWRGCNARNAVETLERIGFVAPAGRAKGRGGPIRYGATPHSYTDRRPRSDPSSSALRSATQSTSAVAATEGEAERDGATALATVVTPPPATGAAAPHPEAVVGGGVKKADEQV